VADELKEQTPFKVAVVMDAATITTPERRCETGERNDGRGGWTLRWQLNRLNAL
jgi:hypothetical protein